MAKIKLVPTFDATDNDMRVVEGTLAALDTATFGRKAFLTLARAFLAESLPDEGGVIHWGHRVTFAGQTYVLPDQKTFKLAMQQLVDHLAKPKNKKKV